MKHKLLSFSIIALFFFSCEKEPIKPLEISDFLIHFGGQNQNTAGNIAIDDYITFLDISRNAIDHEWIIDDGNFFISNDFTKEDSVYNSFIIDGAGKTSMDKKVNILFSEAGLQPIQIVNTFDTEPTDGPATAVQQNGKWVIDTTYMIDVFANLQPAFKVFKGTEQVLNIAAGDIPDLSNSASWPVVEVEAGQSLSFVDVTAIGRPNKRSWSLEGAVPLNSQDSVATVSYFALGTYLGGNFRAIRDGSRPEQQSNKIVPVQVKVVPSSLPFLYEGNLIEQMDETITFNVGGELAPFSGLEGSFIVSVKNPGASFDEVIPVQLAKVNEENTTLIELRLSAPIFNSDIITVTYIGSGIKSADFRTLTEFGPETVAMHFEGNLITSDWASFETEDANWKKAFCLDFWVGNSNGDASMPHFSRTVDKAALGDASMKLDLYNGIENKILQGGGFKDFNLTEKDYLLRMSIFLETGNILTTLETIVQEPNTVITWDITNTPRGEWVVLSQSANFEETPSKRYDFKINENVNPISTDQQIMYIDNYQFIPLEVR